jgi:hypothetical protein
VELAEVPMEQVMAYDRVGFPVARQRFLEAWLRLPDSLAMGALDGVRRLRGYGVVRRCRVGAKIGPLFADDIEVADSLFDALAAFAPGEPIFIDVPETNAEAVRLVERRGMEEVFGCARMYLGPAPQLDDRRVFGITTFELG